jgi:AbiV family abortive infection protein
MDRDNYIKIYENGVLHIETAKKAAQEENYGIAISHLILGSEELMKYQVCMCYFAKTSQFDEKEFEGVFKDHKTKLRLFKEFQESISPDFITAFTNSIVKGEDTSQMPIMKNRFKEMGSHLYHSYSHLNLNEEEKKEFLGWLSNANINKQKGIYVGFENNKWSFPDTFSKGDYERALKFVEILSKQTEIIKHLDITDEELIDILNTEVKFPLTENDLDKGSHHD